MCSRVCESRTRLLHGKISCISTIPSLYLQKMVPGIWVSDLCGARNFEGSELLPLCWKILPILTSWIHSRQWAPSGTSVYSIYKKGSVDVLSSCLCSQSITKSCLWAQILPLKGACHLNRNLCQRKMRVSQMSTWGGEVLIPSLSSAASSQILWDMRMPWLMGGFVVWGFFFASFSLSKTILPFYRVQSGTE